MPQRLYGSPFHTDHIVALKHHGLTEAQNLAWACFHCNLAKSCNLAGVDVRTGRKVFLFNPRRHRWNRHFRWDGPVLVGRTPIGRATVEVLNINDILYVQTREALIGEGLFPPLETGDA
jgi:hypothetical protein